MFKNQYHYVLSKTFETMILLKNGHLALRLHPRAQGPIKVAYFIKLVLLSSKQK